MYKKINLVLVLGILSFFVLNSFGFEYLVILVGLSLILFSDKKYVIGTIIIVVFCGLRFWYWNDYSDFHIIHLNDDQVLHEAVGKICFEPDIRREDVRYVVCLSEVNEQLVHGKVLVKTSLYPALEYGDLISLYGYFETPFEEEEFSYKNYLRIFGVSSLFKLSGGIDLLQDGNGFGNWLFQFKANLITLIESMLQEPASSLVGGVLLGIRKGFSDQIMEEFNVTGLTHIIAVSGYNVSLIILVINKLLPFVPRQIRFYFISFFLIIFMALTGFTASVIRAVIMGIISLLALEVGERGKFLRVILITGLIMAFWNPAFLLHDAGFHLSFLSTLGVVYLSEYVKTDWLTEKLGLREAFVLTIAAQLATLPVIVFNFGRVSLVSPFANLLVAPLVPLSMLFGFLMIIFSWSSLLSFVFVVVTSTVSYLLFGVIKVSSMVPFAAVDFEKGKIEYLLGALLLNAYVIFRFRKRK